MIKGDHLSRTFKEERRIFLVVLELFPSRSTVAVWGGSLSAVGRSCHGEMLSARLYPLVARTIPASTRDHQ